MIDRNNSALTIIKSFNVLAQRICVRNTSFTNLLLIDIFKASGARLTIIAVFPLEYVNLSADYINKIRAHANRAHTHTLL